MTGIRAEQSRSLGRTRLFIGTTNPAKADRLRRAVDEWPFELLGPDDLPEPPEAPVEHGDSHRDVAIRKAIAWSMATAHLTMASDGGLVIPALGVAWDSLTTKRSAGHDADDAQRLERLVALMQPFRGDDRRASWAESVAIARGRDLVVSWEVEGPTGFLAERPSHTRIDGFWAASLWHFPKFGKAYTELSVGELEEVGDPWTRLTKKIQSWLHAGGWDRISNPHDIQGSDTPSSS
jgi:inosine/xanthosine triphosphate pyrophosphatase family protein